MLNLRERVERSRRYSLIKTAKLMNDIDQFKSDNRAALPIVGIAVAAIAVGIVISVGAVMGDTTTNSITLSANSTYAPAVEKQGQQYSNNANMLNLAVFAMIAFFVIGMFGGA